MQIHDVQNAPEAIGPYCHATQVGNLVFCSGQTPLDPATMKLVEGGIAEQTEQVLTNIESVLKGLGLELSNVAKTTVFLDTMDDFKEMNAVYAKRFGDHRPARSTIAVHQVPLGAKVEIECIAELDMVTL